MPSMPVITSQRDSPLRIFSATNSCVLSDGEEPCEIPDAFYDLDKLKP